MLSPRDGIRDQPIVAFAVGCLLRFHRHPDLATHMVPAFIPCRQALRYGPKFIAKYGSGPMNTGAISY